MTDNANKSALDYAIQYGTVTSVQALLTHGVEAAIHVGAFNHAVVLGKDEVISRLWPGVKTQQAFIEQAFSRAIMTANPAAIHKLIKEYHASPYTVDSFGFSALNVALDTQDIALLNTLLCYPDLKLNVSSQKPVLISALELRNYPIEQHTQLVKYLLEQKADYNALYRGKTPLIIACQEGYLPGHYAGLEKMDHAGEEDRRFFRSSFSRFKHRCSSLSCLSSNCSAVNLSLPLM